MFLIGVLELISLALIGILTLHSVESLHRKVKHIMSTQAELAAQLTALSEQLTKAQGEIVAKVSELEAAIANAGATTPEVDTALANLKAQVQALDDLNPDAPATT